MTNSEQNKMKNFINALPEHTTKSQIKELKRDHKELIEIGKVTYAIPVKNYSVEHAFFVQNLKDFLMQNRHWWNTLSKKDILYLIALCSCYRPLEPQTFLAFISLQYGDVNALPEREK